MQAEYKSSNDNSYIQYSFGQEREWLITTMT